MGTILFIIAHLVFNNYHYMYNIAIGLILVYVAIPSLLSYIFFRKLYKNIKQP